MFAGGIEGSGFLLLRGLIQVLPRALRREMGPRRSRVTTEATLNGVATDMDEERRPLAEDVGKFLPVVFLMWLR